VNQDLLDSAERLQGAVRTLEFTFCAALCGYIEVRLEDASSLSIERPRTLGYYAASILAFSDKPTMPASILLELTLDVLQWLRVGGFQERLR